MVPRLTVLTTVVFLLLASAANATRTVEINSGGIGGFPGDDLAGIISGAGFGVGGRTVVIPVPGVFNDFAAGHYTFDTSDAVFVVGGPFFFDFTADLHLEFTFTPITILNLSPFVAAGQFETEPMSMVGFFTAPGFDTINLFGRGTAGAGWFPRDSPNFGLFSVGFGFVPEPSPIVLLGFGIVSILVLRRITV
jgi:hypothetical protein